MHDLKPVFTTPVSFARRWHFGDLAALIEVYGDAEAMRCAGNGQPITRAS